MNETVVAVGGLLELGPFGSFIPASAFVTLHYSDSNSFQARHSSTPSKTERVLRFMSIRP